MSLEAFHPHASEPHASQVGTWGGMAEGWHRWMPRMREWYAPATSRMLDLARIGHGSRVLDVAAGDGDQSLAAAELVGPDGYVLATDPVSELLAFADRSAEQAGVENLQTRVMEAENLKLADGSFDAVICRFGLMFFSDPDRGLGEMNRVLRKGGRVSLVVYDLEGSPEVSLAVSVVRRRVGLPEVVEGATTGLGGQGVLEERLERAGFDEVEVHRVTVPIRMDSATECVSCLQDTSPTLQAALASSSPEERWKTWQEIEQALSRFQGPAGFEVDHRVVIAAATAT